MNRSVLVLVSLVSCAAVALVGCGDDTSDGGNGGGNGGEAQGGSPSTGGGGEGGEPSTGGSGEGGDGGGAVNPATCASYCTTIMSGCTADNAQYATQEACEAECAAFEQGDPGAMSGNSVECRAYHAGVAATPTDPNVHCVHAGPLGGGAVALIGCGDNRCESFCQVAEEVCAGVAGYSFTSFDDCNTKCQTYTDDADFNMNQTSGDTLACRMYHLSVAATGQEEPHCSHLSGSQCTGPQ